MIEYKVEHNLKVEEFREVLINSTLGNRRPINHHDTLRKMVEMGNLTITARHKGKLIGVSRSLTDFSFCTYLSDLAVDLSYQKRGIGKELIRRTKMEAPDAKLILLAAPEAISYYPKIGMTHYDFCYYLDKAEDLI
ncbi:GNAT family N-acetyltransferase [Muricauda sp. 334s03]|jgi:predicted N-acetyltransferase YhbS|uniref:GNAT family N-acetyltransferase n=1 Tax=Flagellimonas yonaguniensis TaxID=3031325 RepID=A0ABT5Y2W2_9FLAO|nr:GNAT family N-acetyltransferase [[Muricauda] yonaguniensis]MDF0717788.1 GNAT family N-acetyltransferase [[Muricauda] yonaguniensis]